jgi:cellulose synthase/poly-beta-1,6-N-acetylglucosamine synthase-like glycosyltransferase
LILVLIILAFWSFALLIQLRYWILPDSPESPSEYNPGVSVIVCAHQSGPHLQRLITCLQAQSYAPFEVVFVNDGPDPNVGSFLNTVQWDKFRVIPFDSNTKSVPGKKAPLTAGIQAAGYPWILVTDADCIPGPEWVSTMMRARTEKTEIVLGVAPFLRTPGILNLIQRFDAFVIAIQYLGAALRGAAYMGVGRNMLYRKLLFDQVSGFASHADHMSGDDDLFVQSAGRSSNVKVSLDPESFVYSDAPGSLLVWIWQKRRHLSTGHIYTLQAKIRTALFAMSWIVFWCGMPLLILYGVPWLMLCVPAGLLWFLFGLQAIRLRHQALIPWYPLLAPIYCGVIVIFAVLLILKPPQRWSLS